MEPELENCWKDLAVTVEISGVAQLW